MAVFEGQQPFLDLRQIKNVDFFVNLLILTEYEISGSSFTYFINKF